MTPSQVTCAVSLPISLFGVLEGAVCVCVCVYQSLDCGWEGPCSQACVRILSGFEHGTHGASGIRDLLGRWGNPT